MKLRTIVTTLLVCSGLWSAARSEELARSLTTLDGKASTAVWSQLPRDTLVAWGAPVEWIEGPVVLLVDGSVIAQRQRGRTLSLDGERLKLSNSSLGPLELPIEWVAGVILRVPVDVQLRDRWWAECLKPAEEDRKHDVVQLDNGDRVTGTIQAWGETAEGRRIEIKTNVGVVAFDTNRVAMVRFDPSLLSKPTLTAPRTLIGLDDGSRVQVRSWDTTDDRVQLLPVLGSKKSELKWPASAESIVFAQPLAGKVRYLDELAVDGYRHVPYLTLAWPYELDRNVIGTQLRAGGRLWAKGVGMHSTSRLTFALDKPYRRFDAILAIDDHTAGRGSVTCRVFVDGEQRFASETIRGGAKPVPISVDLSGGKLLSLIVDYGDGGDTLDRVDWLEARVVE
ncbi:MAG: NPCBM/NEW2 domain-containing protein [Planctomycetaceae bacterium]|nr:NPCBM/NEW2 domain-containing protein [Planctomycetaceae bacterium]